MKRNILILIILILSLFIILLHHKNHSNDIIYLSDDDENIPSEPKRYYDSKYITRKQMKINVPTRGEPPSYQQLGILTDTSNGENIKPLYGRQTYRGSNQWNYFTSLDSHLATKIPITIDSTDCINERGCKELYKNDTINLNDKDYNVNIYQTYAPRYIPY